MTFCIESINYKKKATKKWYDITIDTIIPKSKKLVSNKNCLYYNISVETSPILSISCTDKNKNRRFSIGGPSFSFGGSKHVGFINNFAWEVITQTSIMTALYYKIGYETDYKNIHIVDPEIKFICFFIGVKLGLPYYLNDEQFAIRQGYFYESMYLPISIGADIDYKAKSKSWLSKFVFTLTL